jgi:hypothetical protein
VDLDNADIEDIIDGKGRTIDYFHRFENYFFQVFIGMKKIHMPGVCTIIVRIDHLSLHIVQHSIKCK